MSARRGRLAALVVAALVAGCGGGEAPGRPWPVGTEVVVAEHESRPEGVVTHRDRWRLVEADSANARFERRRDGAPADQVPVTEWVPLRAGLPAGRLGRGRGRVYEGGTDPQAVRVPAGRFRCARTVHAFEASDGAILRVDEWWAPGIPVPVQRWVRWEGIVDSIGGPPRRPGDLPVGTTWAVLESIQRP